MAGAPFVTRGRVRFHQADPAGVLFFGRATELFNAAYEELVLAMGLPYGGHFLAADASTPIVRLEVDYHRPIFAGECVATSVWVERVGRGSFTLRFALWVAPEGDGGCGDGDAGASVRAAPDAAAGDEVRVTARVVFVTVRQDAAGFHPVPVPDALRAALGRYASADPAVPSPDEGAPAAPPG